MDLFAMRHTRAQQRLAGAAAWLPLIVGALLVAIVAVFIFEAPSQITTPYETGYLNTELPDNGAQVETAMR
jgi:hypothetical protein